MEFKYELVVPNNDLPFKMFLFEGKDGNYKVEKHWHSTVELFLVLEGNIDFSINSLEYAVTENQFILVNSNEIHSIHAPEKNITIVVQIPQETFEAYRDNEYILFKSTRYGDDSELITLIRKMYEGYEKKEYGYELKVTSYFYMLLHILVTKYKETNIDKERIYHNRHLEKLSKITEYIYDNFKNDITLESVAYEFGFSPPIFSRIFQKYAMINYKNYLLNVRVQFAYKELINTQHSINDIALNNGFPDSRSFSNAFKKRYKTLPSDYRRSEKEK